MIGTEADKVAVMAAYEDFYVALNDMFSGNSEKMAAVWSHAADVTYMGPDNVFLKGWEEIYKNWQKQAEKKIGGRVVAQDKQVVIGQDLAITNNYEIGENVDKDGQIVKVSIRVTNVFRKENNQWKMISHHTDLLPFLIE